LQNCCVEVVHLWHLVAPLFAPSGGRVNIMTRSVYKVKH
jgi:hypothetical protein